MSGRLGNSTMGKSKQSPNKQQNTSQGSIILLHTVYVQTGDLRSNEHTTKLLKFIKGNSETFKRMNVSFKVEKFNREDLQQSYVNNMLRTKGIERLPALITKNKIYHGVDTIIDTYQQTITYWVKSNTAKKSVSRPAKRPVVQTDEQLVNNFMRDEMLGGPDNTRKPKGRKPVIDSDSDEDDWERSGRDLERKFFEESGRRRSGNGKASNEVPDSIDKLISTITHSKGDDNDSDSEWMNQKRGSKKDSHRRRDNIMDLSDDDERGDPDGDLLKKYLSNNETTFA